MYVPIRTERIILRALKMTDLKAIFRILGDEKTTSEVSWKQSSLEAAERWLERRIQNERELSYSMWAMESITTGDMIGLCGFFPMKRDDVELGYVVYAPYQRNGYATEAAVAAINSISQSACRVVATIRPANIASVRVAEKIGMVKVNESIGGRADLMVYRLP